MTCTGEYTAVGTPARSSRFRANESRTNPVARRLYRLLEVAREEGMVTWRVPLASLAEQLPLTQRYPSHLQRVLQPAHEMLLAAGLLRDATFRQLNRDWLVDYVLASRAA